MCENFFRLKDFINEFDGATQNVPITLALEERRKTSILFLTHSYIYL